MKRWPGMPATQGAFPGMSPSPFPRATKPARAKRRQKRIRAELPPEPTLVVVPVLEIRTLDGIVDGHHRASAMLEMLGDAGRPFTYEHPLAMAALAGRRAVFDGTRTPPSEWTPEQKRAWIKARARRLARYRGHRSPDLARLEGYDNRSMRQVANTEHSWRSMLYRCLNKGGRDYPKYGGRGITVCERWRESFENFLADMGEKPRGTSLDRYPDKRGNYEPGNCRWATPQEQTDNRGCSFCDGDGHYRTSCPKYTEYLASKLA